MWTGDPCGYNKDGHRTFMGVLNVKDPVDPNAMYIRVLYRPFFLGPFESEDAVIAAIKQLDEADPYWDYDPSSIIRGANPLPTDYVGGFPFIEDEVRTRIMKLARPNGKQIPLEKETG